MSNSPSSSESKSPSDASSSDFSRTFKYLLGQFLLHLFSQLYRRSRKLGIYYLPHFSIASATQLCSRGIPFIVNAVILRNFLKVEDFAVKITMPITFSMIFALFQYSPHGKMQALVCLYVQNGIGEQSNLIMHQNSSNAMSVMGLRNVFI